MHEKLLVTCNLELFIKKTLDNGQFSKWNLGNIWNLENIIYGAIGKLAL